MQPFQQQAHMQLAQLSRGYVVSRAIHAVARLGIADHLSDKHPVDIATLAAKTATQPLLLERIINFLSAYGLFEKTPSGIMLTELGKPLQEQDPYSIKAVINMVDESWWKAFSHLDQGLKTGIPPFNLEYNQDFFDYLHAHPNKQSNFDAGMAKLSSYDDQAIAEAFDFSPLTHLVDVGGGKGGLTQAIAQRFPELSLMLFETAQVLNQLDIQNFSANIRFMEGNFLVQVPAAEAYIFKGVLHDFNEENIRIILENCRKNMNKSSNLFIAEQIIPDTEALHPNKTMDIVMMVLLGGGQRSLQDWQKLLESCGFQFKASYPTQTLFTVMQFSLY